ncbi:unnamed protein product [Cunninghamella blakesleeana]
MAKADKSQKKTRSKKDPEAPKRGLSAYMIFSKENRERIKSENPDATFGQIGKLLGEAWKNLDDEGKQKYNKLAEDDKKRYENEKAEYNSKK